MFGYLWVKLRFNSGRDTRTWRWKSDSNENRTITRPTNIRTWPRRMTQICSDSESALRFDLAIGNLESRAQTGATGQASQIEFRPDPTEPNPYSNCSQNCDPGNPNSYQEHYPALKTRPMVKTFFHNLRMANLTCFSAGQVVSWSSVRKWDALVCSRE